MRKLLIGIIASVAICSAAFAAKVAVMGDKNASGVDRLSVDTSGAFVFATDSSVKLPSTVTGYSGGKVSIGTTATPAGSLQVGAGTANAIIGATGDAFVAGDLEVDGVIYAPPTALVVIGTTSADSNVVFKVGSGAATAGPTLTAGSAVMKNTVQVDGTLYNPGITVTSGNYVCFNSTTKAFYVKSTCP